MDPTDASHSLVQLEVKVENQEPAFSGYSPYGGMSQHSTFTHGRQFQGGITYQGAKVHQLGFEIHTMASRNSAVETDVKQEMEQPTSMMEMPCASLPDPSIDLQSPRDHDVKVEPFDSPLLNTEDEEIHLTNDLEEMEEERSEERGDVSDDLQQGTSKKGRPVSAESGTLRKTEKKKKISCDVCMKVLSSRWSLKVHYRRRHTGDLPFECEVCQKKFAEKSDRTAHMRVHTGEKPYSCDVCGQSFTTFVARTRHYRTHTGEKPYTCDICQKQFSLRHALNLHKRIHTGEKPVTCDVCGRAFGRKRYLNKHLFTHSKEKFSCVLCGKSFVRKGNLEEHLRTHSDKREPPKRNASKNAATETEAKENTHQPTSIMKMPSTTPPAHSIREALRNPDDKEIDLINDNDASAENPTPQKNKKKTNKVSCDVCMKLFRDSSVLKVHYRKHTGDLPFECEVCQKKFAHKSERSAHMRLHTGEKPYSCDVCGQSFRISATHKQHYRTHTGEKPFVCEICQRQFTQRSTLVKHMQTHTAEKPYSCNLCEQAFRRKYKLKEHLRTHSKEKQFMSKTSNSSAEKKMEQPDSIMKMPSTSPQDSSINHDSSPDESLPTPF